jgi:oligosaccharide reducing-end xylanase
MNRKIIFFTILISFSFSLESISQVDCNNDVNDNRGKMKPWKKGAWETGNYRNVFLDAGYSQSEIDAKLAKAYADII